MRIPLTSLALLAALAAASPAFADDVAKDNPAAAKSEAAEWVADFDAAAAKAKAAGKDLLVDFTGSDWCGWCIKLHDEVFSKDEFLSAATKDYVLVALDYPRGAEAKAKVPNPARNEELQRKYGIRGFPTILLMTPDGEVYAQGSYQQGGAAPYVEYLAKIRKDGKAAVAEAAALQKELDAAKDDAKAAIVEKALTKLAAAEPGSAIGGRYAKIAQAGLALDPKDEKGVKSRVMKALFDGGQADEGMASEARAMDPKNEKRLLEKAVFFEMTQVDSDERAKASLASIEALEATGNWKDPAARAIPLANASYWCKNIVKDEEKAKAWARKLKEAAPGDRRFARLLADVLGDEATKEPAKEPADKPAEGPAKDK